MKYLIIIIFLLSFILPSAGQQINETQSKAQLASSYYRGKEYQKSAELYLELHSSTKMAHYFDYYINSLIFLKEYKTAEKALKKEIRKTKNNNLEITLGYMYKEMGDLEKSKETYDHVIKNLKKSKGVIVSVGNNFHNRREFEYAEKTYLRGREILEGEMFHSNLASVYAYLRNYNKMMTEYLALVKTDEKNVNIVQSRLNSILRYDFDNSLRITIKQEVIKSIQANPEIIAFNRLLIWMFIIEKNYEQALINSIALDRRTKTEENNILNFAKGASKTKLYNVALTGLEYLIERKPEVLNIENVKQEIVTTEYLRYINSPIEKRINNQLLIDKFESTLNEIGYKAATSNLIKIYAHFLSFYLDQSEEAIKVIERALLSRDLNNLQRSTLRIEMADIHVYNNQLWEATFQYAQIIDANRENQLGDEVKLKKAKLGYYLGDVIWARGMLDGLKASTSKLIANDAMELSLLISANYDLDTISEPIELFAKGDLFIFQNKDSLAFATFDSITVKYPNHSLSDKILLRKAQICEMRFDFESTAAFYETIIKTYSYSTSADDAMYKLAMLYENELNNTDKAQELYKQILLDYPGSIYVSDARNRYRNLRGDYQENQEKTPYESQEFNLN
ncbi:MAG: tetratricopeptide repeat protein [Prolixibacteraceae bacterium]|jgi:tetratricopeptide (TPR) repeat protein|nr:tetratricopeptide repeat protein [Prolixibacteraceae bacterium]